MKKSVLFLTAALSFGVASAQTGVTAVAAQAPALTDVPAGHWAKDAVERLVSRGIILGYPDGTYRGNQTLTRYEAAMIIARLMDQVRADGSTLNGLSSDDMAVLQKAIEELSAELASLGVRVSDLEKNAVSRDDFSRLETRVEQVAAINGDPEALAGIKSQLDTLNARSADYDALRADVDDNAGKIAALEDLTVLLNQDVLELQERTGAMDERLSTLEDSHVELTERVDSVEGRVGVLEDGRVRLTMGVSGGYGQLDRIEGTRDFDVDRVTEGTFAQAQYTAQDDTYDDATDRVRGEDTGAYADGLDASITFGVKAVNINAGNNVFIEEAGVNFGFDPSFLGYSPILGEANAADYDSNRYVAYLDSAYVTGRIGEDARFRAIAKATTVPARPDVVNPVGKIADKPGYNDYLIPSGVRNGVSAGVTLNDLPLSPTLYVTSGYGTRANLRGQFFGARAEAKLGDRGDIGVSFVQNNATLTVSPANNNPGGRTAFGIDASYTQPKAVDSDETLFGIKGVYVASLPDAFNAKRMNPNGTIGQLFELRQQAAEVSAEANFFNVGATANFRAVSPGFSNGSASMDIDVDDDFGPGYDDEVGYGASLSTKLGLAEIGAYGDTYTDDYYDEEWTRRKYGYGAHIGANLNAFRVVGFASQAVDQSDNKDLADGDYGSGYVTAANDVVRYNQDRNSAVKSADKDRSATIFAPGKVTSLYKYTTGVGALVTHDGNAENALVSNLDLAVAGIYNYNSSDSYIAGYGAYNIKAIPNVTVTPFVGGAMYQQNEANRANAADNTVIKGGLNVRTDALDMAFKPQFKVGIGGASYTAEAIGSSAATSGSEWGGTAEVTLNEFFAPSTKLSLGYGYRQADNIRDNLGVKDGKSAVSASVTDFRFGGDYAIPKIGSDHTRTQGVYTQLAWNDALKFNYGVFFNDADTTRTDDVMNVAHGFKVTYGVKF
ncbi:S-layer homology domain-containing protein [Deinococcus lacus]|uniref:S-layer homology domain-containing protein n=1 Tax=Deinococcus lacus TaxID=392561 RepID=A0ABW1YBN9_9DEIO